MKIDSSHDPRSIRPWNRAGLHDNSADPVNNGATPNDPCFLTLACFAFGASGRTISFCNSADPVKGLTGQLWRDSQDAAPSASSRAGYHEVGASSLSS